MFHHSFLHFMDVLLKHLQIIPYKFSLRSSLTVPINKVAEEVVNFTVYLELGLKIGVH